MTKALSTELSYKNEDWFQSLISDCRSIIVEKSLNARMEVIEGKMELGKRLAEDKNYEKFSKGGGKFVEEVSDEIGCSVANIYDCIKFFETFGSVSKALETLPGGKTLSWFKIRQECLGLRTSKVSEGRKIYKVEEVLKAFSLWFTSEKADSLPKALEGFRKCLDKIIKKEYEK